MKDKCIAHHAQQMTQTCRFGGGAMTKSALRLLSVIIFEPPSRLPLRRMIQLQ